TRTCASRCDTGIQRCTDGVWHECNATTECGCAVPGASRTIPCGRCGLASQTCGADGFWSEPTECLDEAECFDGEVERDTSRCGERARICDATCHWRDWTETAPPGACEPGETMLVVAD